MRVRDLYVYPVKSCAGIRVDQVDITRRGPAGDRRWMVVDERGRFITARTEHRLVLVHTAFDEDELVLSAQGGELRIPRAPERGTAISVTVWRSTVDAWEHEPGSAWFSALLGRPVKLVYMPDETLRPADPEGSSAGDVVSFADGYPLLLVSQASLDDLNARLPAPVTMARFRPNLVLDGCEPFAEDEWSRVAIGGLTFRLPKPCDRCSLVTVDPVTAELGKEPLKTLASYRTVKDASGSRVLFGVNAIPESTGMLAVGDLARC